MLRPGLYVFKLEWYGAGGRYTRDGGGIEIGPTEIMPYGRRGERKELPSDGLITSLPTRLDAGSRSEREVACRGWSVGLWLKWKTFRSIVQLGRASLEHGPKCGVLEA